LIYHGHDGFMLEGPEGDERRFAQDVLMAIATPYEVRPGMVLTVPWAAKAGRNWAVMEKV